jgi:anti-sigma regulatory factor (Ser/Thr protein kinase)
VEELSLHVLDVAYNSIAAGAKNVVIDIDADSTVDVLTITIVDDGCGMDEATAQNVVDPFFTTRTTRSVGLGLAFFKQAAEVTGGEFKISSQLGVGTTVKATFVLSSIDILPLGDLAATVLTLINGGSGIHFVINAACDGEKFTFDTTEAEEVFGEKLTTLSLQADLKNLLTENFTELFGGKI